MPSTDECLACPHPRYMHIKWVGTGLPPACIAEGCDCWAFTYDLEDGIMREHRSEQEMSAGTSPALVT